MTINISRYKQFFTPRKYSQILIKKTLYKEPQKVIDLTMGEGLMCQPYMILINKIAS